MKHFILLASGTTEQYNQVTQIFQGTNYGYWHWIDNVWLIRSPFDGDTAAGFRNNIMNRIPGLHFIILETRPRDWARFSDNKWQEWLDNQWKE
jgi:hypothetical protein